MEREAGLSRVQRIGQIAYALLTVTQELDNLDTNRISQGMKNTRSPIHVMFQCRRHHDSISTIIDESRTSGGDIHWSYESGAAPLGQLGAGR
jgi:hypothetical protein